MTHASVFSGIGGPEVAATMLGWENLFHCEINPFGRAVLDYWYPNATSYEDITTTDFTEWRGRVDVLTGGFPCQPFSYAGKRGGANDDRYLWPYMFRCIDQIRPTWVVAENVAGILTMVEQGEVSKVAGSASLFDAFDDLRGRYELRETFTLQRICSDLESHGYAIQPVLVPACAVGAPHRRDRVFIIARRIASDTDNDRNFRVTREYESTSTKERLQEWDKVQQPVESSEIRREDERTADFADTADEGLQGRYDCDTQGHGQSSDGCTRQSCEIHGRGGDATNTESRWTGGLRIESETEGTRMRNVVFGNGCRLHLPSDEAGCGRWENFPSVSPVHRGNDGLPFDVDSLTLSFGKWRTEALKAYGNAIVPQVMYEIFRAIEQTEKQLAIWQ